MFVRVAFFLPYRLAQNGNFQLGKVVHPISTLCSKTNIGYRYRLFMDPIPEALRQQETRDMKFVDILGVI